MNSSPSVDLSFASYLQEQKKRIEETLDSLIPELESPYRSLYQAARYSLLGDAKRIRPIFGLAVCDTFGVDSKEALSPCCCLELIHTYSLIHDDLPCMDDDDFRRGKPSLHKVFPEGLAVLAGDFLLTHAFEILSDLPHLPDFKKIKLISTLARASGGSGMIAGQVMDLQGLGKSVNTEALSLMHRKKTGDLIQASVAFGGILAEASIEQMEALAAYSYDVGLSFQIVDDILDVTHAEQKHGKKVASDIANGKTTFVTLIGLEASKRLADQLLDQALQQLKKLPFDTSLLENLAKYIVRR